MAVQPGHASRADSTPTLKVGDRAPDFTLGSHLGGKVTLSDLRGKNVMLAFYPFAFSGVCSTQMPGYEAASERFGGLNAQVVGISVDHMFALKAWASQLGITSYPLLSDFWPHGAVAQQYGVFNAERGMADRSIFLVDGEGIIRYIDVHENSDRPDEEQIFCALETVR